MGDFLDMAEALNIMLEIFDILQSIYYPIMLAIGIIGTVIGLIYCFFGFKLIKVGYAITGFIFGIMIGTIITIQAKTSDLLSVVIILGFGILFGFLLFKLYKLATFIQVFLITATIVILITKVNALGIILGIILGAISILWIGPSMIFSTAFIGAFITGNFVWLIFHVSNDFLSSLTTVILFILGVYFQWKQSHIKIPFLSNLFGSNGSDGVDNNSKQDTASGTITVASFQELGKFLEQTGQCAMKKTKDLAEIVKINVKISDEKKKINQELINLGNLCYSNYKKSPTEEYTPIIQTIDNSHAKIKEYTKQIEELKSEVKAEEKLEVKAEMKVEEKAEEKLEVKTEVKVEEKVAVKLEKM